MLAHALAALLHAQVNAESLRSTLEKHPTFLWIDGALVGRAGNTNTTTFSGSVFGGVSHRPHVFFAKATADYGQAEHVTNVARWSTHARYNYVLTDLFALEALVQAQHDRFQRLAVRDMYGAGIRLTPYATDEMELAFGTTYLAQHEIVLSTDQYAGYDQIQHRSSTYAAWNVALTPIVEGSAVLYVQPRFDKPDDMRVLHEAYVQVTITKVLAAKVSGSLWYDSDPPAGVRTYDVEVKNSLVVKLF